MSLHVDGPVVVLGCGKMGSALVSRWLEAGLDPNQLWVIDPHPAEWLADYPQVHLNTDVPTEATLALIAVKPQMLGQTLPTLAPLGGGKTLFVSVVAGVDHADYLRILGSDTPVVRTVPNTPAAIGQGITSMQGNDAVTALQLDLAETLLASVGTVVRLNAEDELRLVTAVAGCGPAYVFHLIEAMAGAIAEKGLPADLALTLATETVAGAGQLARQSGTPPGELRQNVTSPNGVTQAALEILMDRETGLSTLMAGAMDAAIKRDNELAEAAKA